MRQTKRRYFINAVTVDRDGKCRAELLVVHQINNAFIRIIVVEDDPGPGIIAQNFQKLTV